MKEKAVRILISMFNKLLNIVYFFLKMVPTKQGKILFCSRQMDTLPLDFLLLQQSLLKEHSDLQCVTLCCRIGHNIKDYIVFIRTVFISMYHLASSEICIIDSYWPAVCLLRHKKNLKVIQLWHAIGKIKKSGYQTIGKVSGRNQVYSKALHMHENYDYIIAGAKAWNKCYCESFHVHENRLLNYGLPRIDYLIKTEAENKRKFFLENPELYGKKIILYAPTFRRNMETNWEGILDAVNYEKYNLIVKNHPGQRLERHSKFDGVYYFDEWKSIDLLAVCDCVITDYSAISLEAAVLNKKTYFWIYDYDEYTQNNGLNYDLKHELKAHTFKDIYELMMHLESDQYDYDLLYEFQKKYLPEELGTSTDKITHFIDKLLMETNKAESSYELQIQR